MLPIVIGPGPVVATVNVKMSLRVPPSCTLQKPGIVPLAPAAVDEPATPGSSVSVPPVGPAAVGVAAYATKRRSPVVDWPPAAVLQFAFISEVGAVVGVPTPGWAT